MPLNRRPFRSLRALGFGVALAAAPVALAGAGYALAQTSDGAACRAGGKAMTRTELMFGSERKSRVPVSDRQWRCFVDREIAARFPDGFTVLDGRGEWRGGRERSHVVIIWHSDTPAQEEALETLRRLYKQRFRQESVARLDSAGCASF